MGQPSHPSKDFQFSNMGKKTPQLGGNSPVAPKPGRVPGNTPDAGGTKKDNMTNGNYTPGMGPGLK